MTRKSPRELINPPSGPRYIRRNELGQFEKGQVEVGPSLAADNNQSAKKNTPPGQGDKGDHRQPKKK